MPREVVYKPVQKVAQPPPLEPEIPTPISIPSSNSLNYSFDGTIWKPESALKSLQDLLILKGSLIFKQSANTASGVNPTLYTVPADYVFFLTSASLHTTNNLVNVADTLAWVKLNISGDTLISYPHWDWTGLFYSSSSILSPALPLPFAAGKTFYVYQQTSRFTTHLCIQGYEIKMADLLQYLGS